MSIRTEGFPYGNETFPIGIIIFPYGKMIIPIGKKSFPKGVVAIPIGKTLIPDGKMASVEGKTGAKWMEVKMTANRRFPADIVAAIRDGKIIGICAGTQPHRFIGIWAVVVEGRVFARSWSLKPRSWYRTFLEEPRGTLQIAGQEIAVRAVQTRSERLKKAIDRAYLEKYNTPGSIKYAKDLGGAKSRATTTEFVPL